MADEDDSGGVVRHETAKIILDPAKIFDRMSQEDHDWKLAHASAHERISERLVRTDQWSQGIEERLKEGVASFNSLRKSLDALADKVAPKPLSRFQILAFILGPLLAAALIVGGFAWQAARYPDRLEFDKAQIKVEAAQKAISDDLSNFKLEQVQVKGDLAATRDSVRRVEDTQRAVNEKLDRLLERKK